MKNKSIKPYMKINELLPLLTIKIDSIYKARRIGSRINQINYRPPNLNVRLLMKSSFMRLILMTGSNTITKD